MSSVKEVDCRKIWPMGAELPSPEKFEKLIEDTAYVAEVKIDGERLTMTRVEGGVRLFTRSGSKFKPDEPIEVTHRWPEVQQWDWSKIPVGTVLDGEAFSKIRRAEEIAGLFNYKRVDDTPMPDDVVYIMFDCPFWGPDSLEKKPWNIRRNTVEKAVKAIGNPRVTCTAFTQERKREFFESIIAAGGEGVVLKKISGLYYQGKKPANEWVKGKRKDTFDCIITGYKPGNGKYKGQVGSVELSQYKNMREEGDIIEMHLIPVCYASGISDDLREKITRNPEEYMGSIAVVEAFERIPGSVSLRHPRIKYIRPEGSKDPRACIVEQPE